jgi:hypothetical protein
MNSRSLRLKVPWTFQSISHRLSTMILHVTNICIVVTVRGMLMHWRRFTSCTDFPGLFRQAPQCTYSSISCDENLPLFITTIPTSPMHATLKEECSPMPPIEKASSKSHNLHSVLFTTPSSAIHQESQLSVNVVSLVVLLWFNIVHETIQIGTYFRR